MRLSCVLSMMLLDVGMAGCGRSRHDDTTRERRTPAYEAGRAAHEIAKESERAAKAAGREVKNGAKEAREGWKDQAQRDKERRK